MGILRKQVMSAFVTVLSSYIFIQTSFASNECDNLDIDTTPTVQVSEFGRSDVIGAANRLTHKKTLQAVGLVTQGKTYPLGIEISRALPTFVPRKADLFVLFNQSFIDSTNKLTFHDDFLEPGWFGVGSQIDSLGHACIDNTCYNKNSQNSIWDPSIEANQETGPFAVAEGTQLSTGIKKLGVETIPPLVTRGIVLDMTKIFNKSRLEASAVSADSITCEHIVQSLDLQGLKIEKGDVVLIHTGWLDVLASDPTTFINWEPGITLSAAQYLINKKIVAVGADNWAVETFPNFIDTSDSGTWPGSIFPVHTLLIPKNGVYILEFINTKLLVDNGVDEFLFVLGQPRFKGAVQGIINPVAIK